MALYSFGSRAKEVLDIIEGRTVKLAADARDLDIGIRGRVPLDVHTLVRLAIELEDLFDVSRVDVVSLTDADPFLAANIIRGERIVDRDKYANDEYELYVLRRAGDLIPLERERQDLILGSGE